MDHHQQQPKQKKKEKNSRKIIYYPPQSDRRFLKKIEESSRHLMPIVLVSLIGLIFLSVFIFSQRDQSQSSGSNNSVTRRPEMTSPAGVRSVEQETPQETSPTTTKLAETLSSSQEVTTQSLATPEPPPAEKITVHQVQVGETLSEIAEKNGLSLQDLRSYNQLENDLLTVGQNLTLIPVVVVTNNQKNDKQHFVAAGETLFTIAQKYGITVEWLRQENFLTSSEVYPGQELRISQGSQLAHLANNSTVVETNYTVQKGDTLYRIATNFGTTVEAIQALNNFSEYTIQLGSTIRVK